LTRFIRSRNHSSPENEQGFTLIEIVIAISLLVVMMIPFADAYITSFSATSDSHIKEVAAMVGDSALDQARALDATDQQNGCVLLVGRSATGVQTEWQSPASGTSQLLSETAEVSGTSQNCAASATTPLPTTAQVVTEGGHTFDVYYYVGTCWETENTASGSSSNACTDPASPPSTDYEMYRVIVAVTWAAQRSGCGTSGCDYVTSTLISTTSNPTFDVNPTVPYINSANNTTFTIDSLGTFQVTTTGFPPPTYTDAAYGNGACTPATLPTGLTLSSTGVLSGTPQPGSAATYTVCMTATNADGTGNQTFTLTVILIPTSMAATANGSTSASVTYGSAATLSESGLPSAATGTVTFTSGATTLCTATLPATSCNTSTSLTPGAYAITASYAGNNTYASSTSTSVNLTVNKLTPTVSITAHGSTSPYTINYGSTATLAETGLPSGATGTVTFTSGSTTLCTATLPTTSCTTSTTLAGGSYTVTGTYSGNTFYNGVTSTNTVSLTVDQSPAITSSGSTSFTVGTAGTFQVTATGYPTPNITDTCSSSLPSGVSFSSSTGALSGTPANGTVNSYTVCLSATNTAGTNTQSFTLTVNGIPTSMSISVGPSTVNYGSTATLTESGLPSAATGTVTFTSGGNTLCTATLPTKTCSTSTTLATGSYTVSATYSGDTTYAGTTSTNTVTLYVDQIPTITSAGSATFTVGTAGSFQVTASGYPAPSSYADSSGGGCTKSTLPSGVSFSASTGLLSGTPASGTVNTYTLCLTATNTAGTSQVQAFTLTVNGSPTSMNYGSTATLTESGLASGATGTVTFTSGGNTLCTATLPTKSCSTSTTLAAGSYTVTGTYPGDTTYAGTTSTNTVTLVVGTVPSITSASSATFTVGSAGSFQVTASGSPSPTYSDASFSGCTPSSPSLPTGVTLSSSGLLSGTPTTAGAYTVCLNATNALGTGTQKFTLTVNKGTATVAVGGVLSSGTPKSITFTATVSGSGVTPTGSVTWTSNHGTCSPSTATLNASGQGTCTISNVSGSTTYTATATYGGDTNYNSGGTGTSAGVQG
jgi:large repetitive protein